MESSFLTTVFLPLALFIIMLLIMFGTSAVFTGLVRQQTTALKP